jgi:sigma-B regulation protein RsbU (phosphoserine phosphatase)
VAKQIPTYLKLITDTTVEAHPVASEDLAAMADVGRAFEQATGWRLEAEAGDNASETPNLMWSAPVNPGVGAAPGHVRLFSTTDAAVVASPRCPLEDASSLAGALGKLWGELITTRYALWQCEANLATGVPVVVREDVHTPPLSERLEAVLRAGAEAVGCEAVALYLLDPATTELKLRSSWGLPRKRLAAPARPLRGALADLEALLGHAVVLTDDQLREYWKVPEQGFRIK